MHIPDEPSLADAERELTSIAASEVEFSPPPYDLQYLQAIHRHLFKDLYDWAGKLRTIDISKDTTRFCKNDRIAPEAEKIFSQLASTNWLEGKSRSDLATAAAEFYGDLNMIHPFREGNGRALRLLFEHLIINAGYQISWKPITEAEWLKANIDAVTCDYSALARVFEKCIGDPLTD